MSITPILVRESAFVLPALFKYSRETATAKIRMIGLRKFPKWELFYLTP
jgi:hypothetical protein